MKKYVYVLLATYDDYDGEASANIHSVWRTLSLARKQAKKEWEAEIIDMMSEYEVEAQDVERNAGNNFFTCWVEDRFHAHFGIYKQEVYLKEIGGIV
jgi:hypothetical protein